MSLTYLWFLLLPSITRICVLIFQCHSLPSDDNGGSTSWLIIDMETPCWQGDQISYAFGVALPTFIVYVQKLKKLIICNYDNSCNYRCSSFSIDDSFFEYLLYSDSFQTKTQTVLLTFFYLFVAVF